MRLAKTLLVLCTAILLAGVAFHTAVFTADGGAPYPLPQPPASMLVADGGKPLPTPAPPTIGVLVADGGKPLPTPAPPTSKVTAA